MVNDSWSEAGNNCIIKWNTKRRRVEVWTVVDVPLYMELGAAYNDPYWYRLNNGVRTRQQAEQIREYYNKSELPPYGETEVETTTQPLTSTLEGSQAVGHTAPNLSVIIIDVDMESDPATEGTQRLITRMVHISRTTPRPTPHRRRQAIGESWRTGGNGTLSP